MITAAGSVGLDRDVHGMFFVPQGVEATPDFRDLTYVPNYNKCGFHVDNDLIREGWTVTDAIPFNENYFSRRAKALKRLKWKNIKEERSHDLQTGQEMVVIYGRNPDPFRASKR